MPRPGILPSNDGNELRPFEKPALPFDSRTRALTRAAIPNLGVVLGGWGARDFLVELTWAVVIAIAPWPIYARFQSLVFGGRSPVLAPLLFALMTGLVLLVPIVLAVHQI